MSTANDSVKDCATIAAAGPASSAGWPGGMWWVAWRQHRIHVLIGLAGIAAIAAALIIWYAMLASDMRAFGCGMGNSTYSCDGLEAAGPTLYHYSNVGDWLTYMLYVAPVFIGAAVGAFVFAREFERGTSTFAFTQSVRRLRWWATKSTVTIVPIVAGLLGLGFLTQWVNDPTGNLLVYGVPLGYEAFPLRGIMPAAFGLLGIACALTAGIIIRSGLPALLTSLVIAGAIVVLVAVPLRPHLLTPARLTLPLEPASTQPGLQDNNDWYQQFGYLNHQGNPVEFDYNNCPALTTLDYSDPDYGTKSDAAIRACQTQQGFAARYIDYIPAAKAWPMQLATAAISTAISAIILAAGALRLRRVPRTRT